MREICRIGSAALAVWGAIGTARGAEPEAPAPAAPVATSEAATDASAASPAAVTEPASAPAPVVAPPTAPPAASAAPTGAESEDGKKAGAAEEESDPFIDGIDAQVRARVMAGWEYETQRPVDIQTLPGAVGAPLAEEHQKFFLRQARVRLKMRYKKRLQAKVSIELADALNDNLRARTGYLRDAYIDGRISRLARFRLGHFKRPFSRIELTSAADLPIRGRGRNNGTVIEDLAWGQRATGAMYLGELKDELLEWFFSATVPDVDVRAVDAKSPEGIDLHARLVCNPIEALSVGVSGAFKDTEDQQDPLVPGRTQLGAIGGDARFKLGGLRVVADTYFAQNTGALGHPLAGGVTGYATYNFDLPKKFQLQPVILGEWSDENMTVFGNEDSRLVLGLNVLWSKWLRILPQLEMTRPGGIAGYPTAAPSSGPSTVRSFQLSNTHPARETFYVMVSAQY